MSKLEDLRGKLSGAVGWTREHSALTAWSGTALVLLSLPLAWWGLTKYRVAELRGVNLQNVEELKKAETFEDSEDQQEYLSRKESYVTAWTLNQGQFARFYADYLGRDYMRDLDYQDQRSARSGSVSFRGWSTWTGWFGMLALALVSAGFVAPKAAPEQVEPFAWAIPWGASAVCGVFTLLTVIFFLTVPGDDGPGYSQGVSLGSLLAIVGGAAATIGWGFEGVKSAARRLEKLEAESDDEDADDAQDASPPSAPPRAADAKSSAPAPDAKPKNRLNDW